MKKILALIAAILMVLPPAIADAAIAIGNGPTASATLSTSFTVSAGSNLVLTVEADSIGATVTGCTYNSVSMTQVGTDLTINTDHLTQWRLVNPATGAHTVTCTGSGISDTRGMYMTAYSGVNQSTPIDTSAAVLAATTNLTFSVAGDFVQGFTLGLGGSGPCPTTPYSTFDTANADLLYTSGGQTSGSHTVGFTCGGGTSPALATMALLPVADPVSATVNSTSQFIIFGDW